MSLPKCCGEVVENTAAGKPFYYCRGCKLEVDDSSPPLEAMQAALDVILCKTTGQALGAKSLKLQGLSAYVPSAPQSAGNPSPLPPPPGMVPTQHYDGHEFEVIMPTLGGMSTLGSCQNCGVSWKGYSANTYSCPITKKSPSTAGWTTATSSNHIWTMAGITSGDPYCKDCGQTASTGIQMVPPCPGAAPKAVVAPHGRVLTYAGVGVQCTDCGCIAPDHAFLSKTPCRGVQKLLYPHKNIIRTNLGYSCSACGTRCQTADDLHKLRCVP